MDATKGAIDKLEAAQKAMIEASDALYKLDSLNPRYRAQGLANAANIVGEWIEQLKEGSGNE